jgi:hypothetical protein
MLEAIPWEEYLSDFQEENLPDIIKKVSLFDKVTSMCLMLRVFLCVCVCMCLCVLLYIDL